MSSPQKSSQVLSEFDPLSSSDHSPSAGQASDLKKAQLDGAITSPGIASADTLPSSKKSATPPPSDVSQAAPVQSPAQSNLATPPHSGMSHTEPSSSSATPTPKATAQPTSVTSPSNSKPPSSSSAPKALPQSAESARSSNISSSTKKKKKKKKRKHHTSSEQSSKSSSDQISSQISEIDKFLQSLKVENYTPDVSLLPAVSPPGLPVAPKVTTTPGSRVPTTGPGVQRSGQPSLGLQLIGGFESSSSSSDSSGSSSDSSDDEETNMVIIEEGGSEEEDERRGGNKMKHSYPMIKDEIHYRDLPPLESCDMAFPEGAQLLALGTVSHITEQLVVIQAIHGTPPVDEGTVLWSEAKKSLSVVFEIFGPVKSPYYSVHVHSPDHAQSLGLDPGKKVFVIPGNEELTKYVFTQQLLQQRGSDASWKNDAEVPEELQDFSDDEKEHEKKKKHKKPPATAATNSQAKRQLPRYSGDPKMQAYFPDRPAPPPLMELHGGAPRYSRPPPRQGGMGPGSVYFTPRGFVGFMPPPYPPPGGPLQPPPAMYPQGLPPQNMLPYQHQRPPMPYYQPNMVPPHPQPLMGQPQPPYYYPPSN